MTSIFDVGKGKEHALASWRDRLMPASFRNARFHCEVNSQESGRRGVMHEFPKKELPYLEDMGRIARQFSVRGYCVVFPYDAIETDILYRRDYQLARNRLIEALEQEGPGRLRLPTLGDKIVGCTRYRVTEEQRFGGFCAFDMVFQEQGIDPGVWVPVADTATKLLSESLNMRDQAQRVLRDGPREPPGIAA